MCANRMDQFSSPTVRRRDPVLRLSNAADIKSIINRFEKQLDEPPKSPPSTKKIPSCYLGDMATVKIDNVDHNNKAIVKKEVLYDAIDENEWYFDEESSAPMGITWRVLRMALYGLTCFFWASHMSLAMIMVTIATFAPRMITDLFIYPCCRLLFGTLYPAYASYKAVRTKNVKEYVKWMMYWIVFALFTCAETFTDVFLSWFPFYYEIKIILVFWLLSPATKGSSILYRKFVHPALCRREQEIDECITKAKEQGYHTVLNLGSKGVNYATNVIVQTALRSGGGIVQQIRKSYSLSDLTASDDQSDGHGQQGFEGAVNAIMAPGTDTRLVRRAVSTKSKNPRPTSAPRVDMYFPEVDVNMTHKQNRDSVNLSHIRSSEDISIAHVPDSSSSQDSLTRTSSVGSTRTRSKVTRNTFTSIKRPGAAEDDDVIIEEVDDDDTSLSEDQNESTISEASIFRDVYKAYAFKHMDLRMDEYNFAEIFDQVSKIRDMLKRQQDIDYSKEAKRVCINDNKENTIDNNELNLKAEVECQKCEIIELKEDNKQCLNDANMTDDDNAIVDKAEAVKLVENEDKVKIELHKKEDEAKIELHEKEDEVKIELHEKEDEVKNELHKKEDEVKIEFHENDIEVNSVINNKVIVNPNENDQIVEEIKDIKLVEVVDVILEKEIVEVVDSVINIAEQKESELENDQSNLSSDAEDGDVEFITPNSSPVMKAKIDKSPKSNKKRPAPPPPISSTSEIKTDLNTNVKEIIAPVDMNIKTEEEAIDLNFKEDVSEEKSPQLTKNKSKKRDPISKLLHLPTKFAFWNKNDNDESDNKSISSDSDFGSLIDLKAQSKDNASMKSCSSISTLPDNDESARRRDSLRASVDDSLDSVYIPLSVDSLMLHTESKSTDV